MDTHPTFAALAPFLPRYSPAVQGAAFQAYNDLLLSQRWADLRVVDLPASARCAFEGVPTNAADSAIVVPCALSENISLDWLNAAFEDVYILGKLMDKELLTENRGPSFWDKIFSHYQETRKHDADAIAGMALENFIEMRDKVADLDFLFEKQVCQSLRLLYLVFIFNLFLFEVNLANIYSSILIV